MTKKLIKTGNSKGLIISKEMMDHMGISGDTIQVEYCSNGKIELSGVPTRSFEDALASTLSKYNDALAELAK
jgi:antitoxin component of MazEF toxin-antitoxin module